MSEFIEIQMDKATLPEDDRKVEWVSLGDDAIKQGYYIADEQMFHCENSDFDFAWHVEKWRYIIH